MHIYRGKYPNRIDSAWRISDRYENEAMRGKTVARTNNGRMFTITLDHPGLLRSLQDIVDAKIEAVGDHGVFNVKGCEVLFDFWMQSTIRR